MSDANKYILVVDDMGTMRKLIIKACKELGYQNFLEAQDGQKAWLTINSSGDMIGLIISDWNMPNCTGIDLLKRLRADSRYKNKPFILVTAESETEQVKEALLSGVNGYIVKPFAPDILKKKLDELIPLKNVG